MNTTELVQFVARGERTKSTPSRTAPPPFYNELVGPLRSSILRARDHLLNEQRVDGSWLARQIGDASLPSQLILLLAYLERDETGLIPQAVAEILDQQHSEGGWSPLPDDAIDLSTSVQAYFALKLAGFDPSDDRLSSAREAIRRLGGAEAVDATTRRFLALFGQVSYDNCLSVPAEQLLRAGWCNPNVESPWQQMHRDAYLASLAVIWALRPVRRIGVERGVRELFIAKPIDRFQTNATTPNGRTPLLNERPWKLRRLRHSLSAVLWKQCERWGLAPLRRRALDRAEAELLRATRPTQIVQLTLPELVWQMIAMEALGFTGGSREARACENRLLELVHVDEEADVAQPQLCTSPWTDTGLVYRAMRASGLPESQATVASAARWLASPRRSHTTTASSTEIAMLAQRFDSACNVTTNGNALPPDLHTADSRFSHGGSTMLRKRHDIALRLLVDQLMERQNRDGGWSPTTSAKLFSRQSRRNLRKLRRHHGLGSAPDVTGAVLEAIANSGREQAQPVIDRAVAYLRAAQRADGSWDSATGLRLIHGTSAAIRGLVAAGLDKDDEAIAAGVNWLIVHQQPSGGWGEAASLAQGEAHYQFASVDPSQTAWALSALVTTGRTLDPPARRAVKFLLDAQDDNGQWHNSRPIHRDPKWNRWYRNDLHAVAWPLMALSQWAVAASVHSAEIEQPKLRLVGVLADA